MKKEYKTPLASVSTMDLQSLLIAVSQFNMDDNQAISGSKDEYNGEFQSRPQNDWFETEDEY